jgi:hypothetical protein
MMLGINRIDSGYEITVPDKDARLLVQLQSLGIEENIVRYCR